jgi:hypothetical protein
VSLHRILYAEDEPLIQAVAKLALEKVGGFVVLFSAPVPRHWRRWPNAANASRDWPILP